jgi:hypothetical protein
MMKDYTAQEEGSKWQTFYSHKVVNENFLIAGVPLYPLIQYPQFTRLQPHPHPPKKLEN